MLLTISKLMSVTLYWQHSFQKNKPSICTTARRLFDRRRAYSNTGLLVIASSVL